MGRSSDVVFLPDGEKNNGMFLFLAFAYAHVLVPALPGLGLLLSRHSNNGFGHSGDLDSIRPSHSILAM